MDRRKSSCRTESSCRRRSSSRGRSAERRRASVDRTSSVRRMSSSRRRSSVGRKSSLRKSYIKNLSFRSLSSEDEDESLLAGSDDYDHYWDSDYDYSDITESEHTLSTTVKTNIQMEEDGLGLILIQNGPYIQISGLVEKSAAVRDGKLRTGDILLKIGHANVLGWTLRELRQLLHNTPIGTVLQIQVYRDFMKLPVRWEVAFHNVPEIQGTEITDISSCGSEDAWTSSEGSADDGNAKRPDADENWIGGGHAVSFDDDGVCTSTGVTCATLHNRAAPSDTFRNVKAVRSLSFDPSNQPKWISKDWHIFERKTYTFTVGSDIGCDIMVHKDFEVESDTDVSTSYLTSSSPYWTMSKHRAESSMSSTSSSVSDAFWLENFAYEFEQ